MAALKITSEKLTDAEPPFNPAEVRACALIALCVSGGVLTIIYHLAG